VGDFLANFDHLSAVIFVLWACGQRACVVHHVHSDAISRGLIGLQGSALLICYQDNK